MKYRSQKLYDQQRIQSPKVLPKLRPIQWLDRQGWQLRTRSKSSKVGSRRNGIHHPHHKFIIIIKSVQKLKLCTYLTSHSNHIYCSPLTVETLASEIFKYSDLKNALYEQYHECLGICLHDRSFLNKRLYFLLTIA